MYQKLDLLKAILALLAVLEIFRKTMVHIMVHILYDEVLDNIYILSETFCLIIARIDLCRRLRQ